VFTFSHLILDGWSVSLLLNEAFGDRARRVASPRQYRDFVAWVASRDKERARAFWRTYLDGFAAPALLAANTPPASESAYARVIVSRPVMHDVAATLESMSRHAGLTMNSILLGMWALVVSAATGADDVSVGTLFSGRDPALERSDEMRWPPG